MKRFVLIFFAAVALGVFSACNAEVLKNVIRPVVLTEEQKEITDVFSSADRDVLLFDMQTEDDYANFEA